MVITILTIGVVFAILLTGVVLGTWLWLCKHPLSIEVRLPPFAPFWRVELPQIEIPPISVVVDMTQAIPSPLVVQAQMLPPDRQPYGVELEPMPLDVLTYVDQESDEWARVARRQRARVLRNELGNWEMALASLRREDEMSDR